MLEDARFQILLKSARLGTRLTLYFQLSENQLRDLLQEVELTSHGELLVEKASYDDDILALLKATFPRQLKWK